jgi:hypothetical protein
MVNVFEQLTAEWYEFKGYFVSGSAPGRDRIGGAQLVTLGSFINEIRDDLKSRPITKVAVLDQFYLLRTLQLAAHH